METIMLWLLIYIAVVLTIYVTIVVGNYLRLKNKEPTSVRVVPDQGFGADAINTTPPMLGTSRVIPLTPEWEADRADEYKNATNR